MNINHFPLLENKNLIEKIVLPLFILVELLILIPFLTGQIPLVYVGLLIASFVFLIIIKEPIVGIGLYLLISYTELFRFIPKIVTLLILVLIFAFVLNRLIARDLSFINIPQTWLILLFLSIILFSLVIAIRPGEGIWITIKFIRVLIVFFLVIHLVRTLNQLEAILWFLVVGGLFNCLGGFYLIYTTGIGSLFLQKARFVGMMTNANFFAGSIVPLLGICYYLFKLRKNLWLRIFLIGSLFIFIFSIIFSLSRGGLLSMSLVFLIIFLQEYKTKRWLILIPILLFIGVIVIFPEVFIRSFERFSLLFSESADSSVSQRKEILKTAFQIYLDHPLWGVGNGNFLHLSRKYSLYFLEFRVAHNSFFEVLIELGVAGLIVFVLVITQTIFDLRKVVIRSTDMRLSYFAKGVYAGLLGFLATCLTASKQYSPFLWFLLAVAIAIYLIYQRDVGNVTKN